MTKIRPAVPILKYPRRCWRWLTRPLVSIESFETNAKSRWLTSVLLILMPLGILMTALPESSRLGKQSWDITPGLGSGLILILAFLPLYILSRLGHYRSVAAIAVVMAIAAILFSVMSDSDTLVKTLDSEMLILPILFTSIMFGSRATIIVLAANAVILLILPLVMPEVTYPTVLSGPFVLIIMGSGLSLFGAWLRDLLEKHHTTSLLKTNAALHTEIVERQRVEKQISELLREKEAALREKEVLLKEVHHRVKNNLQIVSSLLSLQSAGVQDHVALSQYQDNQSRIRSMALIHEQLYRSDDLTHIDFGSYLRNLVGSLVQTHKLQPHGPTFEVGVDDVQLDIDTAIPCGLLVNELVSNALKHAFPRSPTLDRPGFIHVELRHAPLNHLCLSVEDNGVGIPADLDYRKTTSLGLQLVNSLARQLEGTLTMHSTASRGTRFELNFIPTIGARRSS